MTLDDLRTEDGGVDAEKVKAALDKALIDHPSWKQKGVRLGGGVHGGAPPRAPSFSEALKDQRRRIG